MRILRDGETFRVFRQPCRAHTFTGSFIFEDIECSGEHLGDLPISKRQSGVEVAIIYDPVGSARYDAFFDRLKKRGVKIFEFHPLNLKAKGPYQNDRDHRKCSSSTALMPSSAAST